MSEMDKVVDMHADAARVVRKELVKARLALKALREDLVTARETIRDAIERIDKLMEDK